MKTIDILDMTLEALNGRHRTIRIFLPDSYTKETEKHYPVLYMHDGQNLVDPAKFSGYSWDVLNTAHKLANQKQIPELIIVGIDSDDEHRIEEYTHSLSKHAMKGIQKYQTRANFIPEGENYARFIVNQLKPYVDSHYRTLPGRETTAIAGSSCGGNISLYIGANYDHVFSIVGAFSPAYWIIHDDIYKRIKDKTFQLPMRFYHDMGGKENGIWTVFTLLSEAKKMNRVFLNHSQSHLDSYFVIDRKARHTELFWQDRFYGFLLWAFGE